MVLTQKVCVQLQEGRSLCFVVPAPCPSMHANQRMQKTTVQFTGGKAKKKKTHTKTYSCNSSYHRFRHYGAALVIASNWECTTV